ncbi:transcriptional regulator, ArsR family [Roseibium hamelinense]|uniref:Transcriptional regulator, ArsR family n=1 Tax=Roseibium hamelinense TaxID=150831 RepID=A0A562T9E5_9HYPH|nr:metalloregulator ArsR/SmtB family transcription factor [Roseibium hamelinense]MTI45453.1 transcriptional regulator [Roseibium hamelinense]TWI90175.1 transcriptional regulator, ArsR family [Roseibium hamelinense]
MDDDLAISALAALAQKDRLATFRLLVSAGEQGLPSGQIAERLNIQPTRMSFHLSALERAGLLRTHRDGRRIFYAVSYAVMKDLLEFLTKDCCSGHPEICCDLGPQHTETMATRL